ncbi:MAG: ribosome small subunit-dependent GTPase A [Euzebyales bacterium]|nr:ribosome small subunit-dependent GTPase A [Euzebyales bacterium]
MSEPTGPGLLDAYGWTPAVAGRLAGLGGTPGRVVRVDRGACIVVTAGGLITAGIGVGVRPATGDWTTVAGDPPMLDTLAERTTALVRRAPSGRREQVLAAEIQAAWIILGMDRPINAGRVERALVVTHDAGIAPSVVLAKADLAADLPKAEAALAAVAPGVPVHPVIALTGEGLAPLRAQLATPLTVALVGESGAGKSTLVNALAGQDLHRTAEVRARDRKGRHTTVSRELVPVPGGGVLLDAPGVRELGVLAADRGLAAAFPEIAALARDCRFADCAHGAEPGCAVQSALADGRLEPRRWSRYQVLAEEVAAAHAETERGGAARGRPTPR